MIDIVCPSCQARYRLPDGAIGENGRRVSCSACGHAWQARPEPEEETLTLGPEVAADPAPERSPAAPAAEKREDKYTAYDSDDRVSGTAPYSDEEDRGIAAYEAFARSQEDDEDAEQGPSPAAGARREDELAGDRAQQMAQIRSMLDDIKQSPQTAPAAQPAPEEEEKEEGEEPPPPPRPSAVERSMREVEEEEERDPLRAKLDQYAKPGKTTDSKQTRSRMLKKHAKKVRRRKMEEKRRGGTFTTGFLLVVLVVSVMAAVYLLAPLIVARFPDTEPAMRDYVATMDQFRLWLGEQVGAAQQTVERIIADE